MMVLPAPARRYQRELNANIINTCRYVIRTAQFRLTHSRCPKNLSLLSSNKLFKLGRLNEPCPGSVSSLGECGLVNTEEIRGVQPRSDASHGN